MKLKLSITLLTTQQNTVRSLRETGFGVLKNHPIPKELVESIYENWYQFFISEEKEKPALMLKHKMDIFHQCLKLAWATL